MAVATRSRARVKAVPRPEADPRFRKVMDDLKRGGARVKFHPPAARKALEAGAAAKGPPNERLAAGKTKQVEKVQEAPAKKPETSSFLAMLQAEIAKVMPKTLGDTEKFMQGGSSGAMKGGLKGNVSQQKDQAAGGVKSAAKESPTEAGAAKDAKPIPPDAPTPPPAVDAAEGMPAPKPEADVSLQDSKQDVNDQIKQAEINDKHLADKMGSKVGQARDAVSKQADSAPSKFRASEKGTLGQAATSAQANAKTGAGAMVSVKGAKNSAVLSKQQQAKARDEAKRLEVTTQIEAVYSETKKAVEDKLNSLDTVVGDIFDKGVDAAIQSMKDYVDDKIFQWKLERYLMRVGGALLWAKDLLLGLPDEVQVFYDQGRNLFTKLMNILVTRVADLVERTLQEAKQLVGQGRTKIQGIIDKQPKELQAGLKEAQQKVSSDFDSLEASIDDKKNQLAQQLAEKYKAAFDRANAELDKMQQENRGLVDKAVEAIGEVVKILTEFKAKLMALLKKGEDTIKLIIADPVGFLGNLLAAIKLGFNQFVGNIWAHLKKGFFTWLFGALAESGIEIPGGLPSLPSILQLVLSVLGITYERMRAKAVKLIGERAVSVIETLVKYVKALIEGGPAKLWEQIKEDLSSLKEMVIGAIQDYIVTTVVQRAIAKLVTMFNPVGAIVQAVLAIYDTVTFLIEKASQIYAVVEAVINSANAIATGAIGGAANWIEQALARLIPVVIGFLAQFVGLGKVSKKIKEFIQKVQAKVDKAIDKAIAKVVAVVKKLIGKLTGKDKKDERTDDQKKGDLDKAISEAEALQRKPKITEAKIKKGLLAIKQKYKMTSLDLVVDSDSGSKETVHVVGEINPKKPGEKSVVDKMKGMTVAEAVVSIRSSLKAGKTNFEIRVHTEEDARAVIAQAFPTAKEATPPSVESAYSDKDAAAIREHREGRGEQLGFHVDTKRYNADEVEAKLRQEIKDLEGRDIPTVKALIQTPESFMSHPSSRRLQSIYHSDPVPAGPGGAAAPSPTATSRLDALTQTLKERKAVLADLAAKRKEWEKHEKEGVLYGHAGKNMEGSPHQKNPHVNVEGKIPTATTEKAEDEVIIKVAIYIKPKK
jgi:hypothetical protein